jgi:urease accessory protein
LARTRLLQIASQVFPIGGFSHSQGLESAVESGIVSGEASVLAWIDDVLQFSMNTYELPSLEAMSAAWRRHDVAALHRANEEFLATRESFELRHASVQMGYSMGVLMKVLPEIDDGIIAALQELHEPSLPCVWSALATAWSIDAADSMTAYLWVWAENQVLVALKAVPIGQSAGQRILFEMGRRIARCVDEWHSTIDRPRSNFAPGLAILSSQHETQYSRLFRS